MQARADCPHQANLCVKYKDKIERHEVLPETGSQVHALAKTAIESNEHDLQEAADYIAEELPKIRPDLQPEALRAGRNLANEIRRFQGSRLLLCEEPVTRSLMPATQEMGEILIVSELDLVLATSKQNTIIVLDYKTGYKDRTNAEAMDEFQTCVGCWVLWGKYPDVDTIHWWYLNTRLYTRSYARLERERDEANFGARIFEVARLYLEKSDEAWPEPKKCSWCPVTRWCKQADYEAKELDGKPKEYIDAFIALEARYDKMKAVIQESCKSGRRLYGTGGWFDDLPKRKPSQKISFKEQKKN
jgi:CRISPR/Cas system-associated exonuclease Cas4 (RecB family)